VSGGGVVACQRKSPSAREEIAQTSTIFVEDKTSHSAPSPSQFVRGFMTHLMTAEGKRARLGKEFPKENGTIGEGLP